MTTLPFIGINWHVLVARRPAETSASGASGRSTSGESERRQRHRINKNDGIW